MKPRPGIVAFLFLATQFAPEAHAILPHEVGAFHCTDGIPFPHFEPRGDHPLHSDCGLCTQLAAGAPPPASLPRLPVVLSEPLRLPPRVDRGNGLWLLLDQPRAPPGSEA